MDAFDALSITRLNETDLPAIMKLMGEVVARLPSQALFAMDDEAYLREKIADKGEIYGVYNTNRLQAYSVLSWGGSHEQLLAGECGLPERDHPLTAMLDGTVVHESHRGLGLQRRFHELREQRAQDMGYQFLISTVHPDNAISIRNLESAGFQLRFTKPMYGGKPRHCYLKRLT